MNKRSLDPDIRLLAALADPTRLAIVRELAGSSEVCACDFGSCCDVRQPTVSHHLKVLREAGIIIGERRGTGIWYRLAPDLSGRLVGIARDLIPGGLIPVGSLRQRARTSRTPGGSPPPTPTTPAATAGSAPATA
ncbi:MAG: metalloregulator ArsR/SmtB family transcription factor [Chloroflexota bacterium]|nr:metalloregulator ArsR/SmtB family transcription factor [Chloroflexota bacterium]